MFQPSHPTSRIASSPGKQYVIAFLWGACSSILVANIFSRLLIRWFGASGALSFVGAAAADALLMVLLLKIFRGLGVATDRTANLPAALIVGIGWLTLALLGRLWAANSHTTNYVAIALVALPLESALYCLGWWLTRRTTDR